MLCFPQDKKLSEKVKGLQVKAYVSLLFIVIKVFATPSGFIRS